MGGEQGWDVHAFDLSEVGVSKTRNWPKPEAWRCPFRWRMP